MRKYLVILLVIFAVGCSKAPLSIGPMTTEMRSISSFHRLKMFDDVRVRLVRGDSAYIELTAGSNLMKNIITEVNDGTLKIKNENTMDWIRSYDTEIRATVYYTDDIDDIYYESVGGLVCVDTMNVKKMNIEVYDGSRTVDIKVKCEELMMRYFGMTADVVLSGETAQAHYKVEGLGPMRAENLVVKNSLNVDALGTNDSWVNCCGKLKVKIDDLGDVYYKGYEEGVPAIDLTITPKARGRLFSY